MPAACACAASWRCIMAICSGEGICIPGGGIGICCWPSIVGGFGGLSRLGMSPIASANLALIVAGEVEVGLAEDKNSGWALCARHSWPFLPRQAVLYFVHVASNQSVARALT